MLKIGFLISLSGLLSITTSYILRIFISNNGGVDQVGLYNAGFNIINVYVGMVFTAMGTDYYPRLSGVAHDSVQLNQTINQQAEVAILILAPILLVFITFINWVVLILYSQRFLPINGMIHWAALAIFFKASSWAIAFTFLAKGASRLFFLNELVVNIYMLGFNILGYYLWGLEGLGISFLIIYLIYFIQVYWICKVKYKFSFNNGFKQIISIQLGLALLDFLVIKNLDNPFNYFLGTFFTLISLWYSIKELDKRMDIKQIFLKFRNKNI